MNHLRFLLAASSAGAFAWSVASVTPMTVGVCAAAGCYFVLLALEAIVNPKRGERRLETVTGDMGGEV